MRITFVNRLAGILWGGGETIELEIAKSLTHLGHDVQFIVGRRWSKLDLPMTEFPTTYVRTPYLRWLMYRTQASQSRLLRGLGGHARRLDLAMFERMAFKRIVNDGIASHADIFQINGLPRLGAWLREKLDARSVILWHGPPSPKVRHCSERCSATLAYGDSVETVRKNVDPQVVEITPGVDTQFFQRLPGRGLRQHYGLKASDIVFLFVGRLIPIKNLDLLLKAFASLTQVEPIARLVLVGDGPERRSLERQAENLGIRKQTIFAGYQSGESLVRHYSIADVFCITSNYESFSLVTLEAMACELPIIATRVGFIPRIVEHSVNGFLVDNANVQELSAAMSRIASNTAMRLEMGRRNREKVMQKYSWLETARQMVSLYQSLG